MMRLLADLEARLGPAPRRFSSSALGAFDHRLPDWLSVDDPLRASYDERHALAEQGELTVGTVIMANAQLWQRQHEAAPAEVLYTFDPALLRRPDRYVAMASELFAFHEAQRTPARNPLLRDLEDDLQSGFTRCFHRRVPPHLVEGHLAWHASVTIPPAWLPSGMLTRRTLPLLVDRRSPGVCRALVVPSTFWPDWWARTWIPEESA